MAIGAVLAGVSAVTSIVGGVMGSQQASRNNAAAKKAEKEQRKLQEEQAEITNEYRKKAFEAEKKDYYAQREFQWETLNRQYQYDNSIIDYRFLQDVRMYGKSVNTFKNTLVFNSIASQQAYESIQAQLGELRQEQAFAKQNMLVERLAAEGQTAVGQAGRSQMKAEQVTLADQGRNLAVMREELRSADRGARASMLDVGIQRYAADQNALANLMLRPERAPRPLAPEMGPERTFVKPPKAIPGFVPPAIQQSTMAPIIGGISSAAGSLAGIDWGGKTPTNRIGG
tara:strand:- start:53 stop:907 length:855 start_codon:yes stop_codon:yes gene_type:complete